MSVEDRPGLIHRKVGGRHLPGDPTFEVDAEVQPLEEQRSQGDHDQRCRDRDAPPTTSVEINGGFAVVQTATEAAALVDVGQDVGGHDAVPETSIPITLRLDIQSVRDISNTAG